jgi:thermitase
MARAIDYARQRGVIPVSSAGNDGACVLRYPAALSTVLGIGSTSDEDERSSFSNYGNQLVWAAAPGEGIVTTYPGDTYAASWGTSFSTPIASAAVALMAGLNPDASYADTSWGLAQAVPIGGQMGYGRIDLRAAIEAVRSRWDITSQEPGPAASCSVF